MRSYGLLLYSLRRRLMVCGGLSMVVPFLLAAFDLEPQHIEQAPLMASLATMMACLFGVFGGFHTALFGSFFPVTPRQRAWLPTLCLGILVAAAILATLLGLGLNSLINSRGPMEWLPLLWACLRIAPFCLLVLAFFDRLVRVAGLGAAGFVAFPQLLFLAEDSPLAPTVRMLAEQLWPLWIGLGVFFILEGPIHLAALDHPSSMKQGFFSVKIRQGGTAPRTPAPKVWADVIMLLFVAPPLLYLLGRSLPKVLTGGYGTVPVLYGAVCAAIVPALMWHAWRTTQASALAPGRSVIAFLLRCSIVLLPLSQRMGVKAGLHARCPQCGGIKFLWATQCPHCQHAAHGEWLGPIGLGWRFGQTRGSKKTHHPFQRRPMTLRMVYRLLLPVYIIAFSLLITSGEFRSDRFTVPFSPEVTRLLKARLSQVDDVAAWLNAGEEPPLQLPEHYRIELTPDAQALSVACYWPRWEPAGAIGSRLQQRVKEALVEAGALRDNANLQPPNRSGYHSRTRFRPLLAGYLDGKIHWLEP